MRSHVRQGDLLFVAMTKAQYEEKIASAKRVQPDENGRLVLALGETTGHAHVIDDALAELFEDRDGTLYLRTLTDNAPVKHENPDRTRTGEHDDVIPSRYGVVIRQREYTPQEIRRVAD